MKIGEFSAHVFIECGEPEIAKEILSSTPDIEPLQQKRLSGLIEDSIHAKQEALNLLDNFYATSSDNREKYPDLTTLKEAYRLYEKSPEIKMNLSFALRNNGEYQEASRLLVSVVNTVSQKVSGLCLINAALCNVLNKNIAEAFQLFEYGINYLNPSGSEMNHIDMPGMVDHIIFLEGDDPLHMTVEHPALNTVMLMDSVIETMPQEQVPEAVKQITHLWRLSSRSNNTPDTSR